MPSFQNVEMGHVGGGSIFWILYLGGLGRCFGQSYRFRLSCTLESACPRYVVAGMKEATEDVNQLRRTGTTSGFRVPCGQFLFTLRHASRILRMSHIRSEESNGAIG